MSWYFQMKCTDKLSDIPPMQNCHWQEMKSSLIYVINESPFKTDGGIRSSFQMKYTTRSTCQMKCSDIPPNKIRWCVQMRMSFSDEVFMSFSDEVFMFNCCMGNMSSWTLSNLYRLLCIVVVAVIISCWCCPVIVLVHVQLQMNFNNNNNIT